MVEALYNELLSITNRLTTTTGIPIFPLITITVVVLCWFASLIVAAVTHQREQRRRQAAYQERLREEEEHRRREQEERQEREQRGEFLLSLQPRHETFTPRALQAGKHYRVIVAGTFRYRHWGWWRADPVYHCDAHGNFAIGYKNLTFDGQPVQPIEADRHIHSYVFNYVGTGQKLCILLLPPEKLLAETADMLKVEIAPLPPEEEARLQHDTVEAQVRQEREEQTQQQEDQERRREESAQHRHALDWLREHHSRRQQEERRREELQREEIERRQEEKRRQEDEAARAAQARNLDLEIFDLKIRAEVGRVLLDPAHRENLARNRTAAVLGEESKFIEDYRRIMGDVVLLPVLKERAPEVLEWLQAQHLLILRAKEIDAGPPPKKRPTEEQIRRRKAHVIERAAKDQIAEKTARLRAAYAFDEELKKDYDLDEDERGRLVAEFLEELDRDDQDGRNKIQ